MQFNEQETDERKLRRLNLVLRTIRNVNQLLVKEKDRTRLLRGICDTLIENRGYYNAWVVMFDESGGLIASAEAGLGEQFLPLLERFQSGKLTYCARNVLSHSGPLIIEDPSATCKACPLSANYGGRGGIAAQLKYGGKVYGILCGSIPKSFVSDQEEQGLFEEIAGDIAFALHDIELNEERERLLEELQIASTYPGENPYPVLRVSPEGIVLFANAGSGKILDSWGCGVGERVPEPWLEAIEEVLASGVKKEMDIEAKDDVFSLTVVPVTVKEYVNIYGMNITDRKHAEEALREGEKRFRDLVVNSLVGIGIIQDGQVVYRNPEQERLWGPVRKGVSGSAFEYVHPDDADKVEHALQEIVGGKVPSVDMDLRFHSPDKMGSPGDMQWVRCRTSVIEYDEKESILVNMMDITRAKEMEKRLRVADKMASLGRVAAGIAHEIRNPLSGINIYLDTLVKIYDRSENLDKVKRILEQVQSASNKIDSVVRRVMDFAKPVEPKLVLADINEPIEEALNLALVTLRKAGVKVEKNLTQSLPRCRIDPPLIEEVILNLMSNSAEAMNDIDRVKRIGVSSAIEGESIVVRVFDSGPGVSAGVEDKIFDPFYTTKNGSTGIGLSLAHRIVGDHGGFLGVFKSEWGGAEFVIELPAEQGID